MRIVFTKHALDRMRTRRIAHDEVVEALKRPDVTTKRHGSFILRKSAAHGTFEVCCEREPGKETHIKVITVYWV